MPGCFYDPLQDVDPPAGVHIELANYYLGLMVEHKSKEKPDLVGRDRDRCMSYLLTAYAKCPMDNQFRDYLGYLMVQQDEITISEAFEIVGRCTC